jgi:hypothetical protein
MRRSVRAQSEPDPHCAPPSPPGGIGTFWGLMGHSLPDSQPPARFMTIDSPGFTADDWPGIVKEHLL